MTILAVVPGADIASVAVTARPEDAHTGRPAHTVAPWATGNADPFRGP